MRIKVPYSIQCFCACSTIKADCESDYRSKQGIEYANLLYRDKPCQLKEYINNHQTKQFPPGLRAGQHHTSKHHTRQTNPSNIRSNLPPGRDITNNKNHSSGFFGR